MGRGPLTSAPDYSPHVPATDVKNCLGFHPWDGLHRLCGSHAAPVGLNPCSPTWRSVTMGHSPLSLTSVSSSIIKKEILDTTPQNDLRIKETPRRREGRRPGVTQQEYKERRQYSFPAPTPLPHPVLEGLGSPISLHPAGGLVCDLAAGLLGDLRKNRPSACSGWGQSPSGSAGLTWPPRDLICPFSPFPPTNLLPLFKSSASAPSLSLSRPVFLARRRLSQHLGQELPKVLGPSMPGDSSFAGGLAQSGTAAPEGRREMEVGRVRNPAGNKHSTPTERSIPGPLCSPELALAQKAATGFPKSGLRIFILKSRVPRSYGSKSQNTVRLGDTRALEFMAFPQVKAPLPPPRNGA